MLKLVSAALRYFPTYRRRRKNCCFKFVVLSEGEIRVGPLTLRVVSVGDEGAEDGEAYVCPNSSSPAV